MSTVSRDVDPDETKDLRDLIAEVVKDPNQWLDTENDLLGGKKPKDLLNTPQAQRVRDLARAIKHGMPT